MEEQEEGQSQQGEGGGAACDSAVGEDGDAEGGGRGLQREKKPRDAERRRHFVNLQDLFILP